MIIRIKNLKLRALIGINPWERTDKQAVVINLELEFDGEEAAASDNVEKTLDYRGISKKVINLVENSEFYLIEALAKAILDAVLEDPQVQRARVEVDKPFAIRSADSTSIEVSGVRS